MVQFGGGADQIAAAVDIAGRTAIVDTGAGADNVGLCGSNAGSPRVALTLNLGAGDDELIYMFPKVASAVLIGGGGSDKFIVAPFTAPVVAVMGFEVFG